MLLDVRCGSDRALGGDSMKSAEETATAKEPETWGWSHSDEEATGEDEAGSTREEAIAEALRTEEFGPGDTFWTFRRKMGLDERAIAVSADAVLEHINDSVYEEFGEAACDRIDAINSAAKGTLETRLTEVLRAWLAENGVDFSGWFSMEDCESYTVPVKDEAA